MCSDNARIIEGTDAIWPQQSFVATCLSYSRWKMDKMDWWGSGEGPLITSKGWKTGTDVEDIEVDESILLIFKCELDIWGVKTENSL